MNEDFHAGWTEPPSTPAHSGTTVKPAGTVALKQIVTIRLDVDMLDWFKSAGPGYQTRINQVLREYMDAEREKQG